MKKVFILFLIFMIGALVNLTSCKKRGEISPSMMFNKKIATTGGVIEAEYNFTIPAAAKVPDYDGTIFVHFVDSDGSIAFTDDHKPEKPITTWKAGETISYKRLIFIPNEILPGEFTIQLGIYDPQGKRERFPLNGKEIRDKAYEVASLIIKSPPWELIKYQEGWYDLERAADDPFMQWRWTKKNAIGYLLNPLKNTKLYIEFEANPSDYEGKAINIVFKLNDNILDQINLTKHEKILKIYELTKEKMGIEKYLKFEIETDKTFIPSKIAQSSDNRELGIRVYKIIMDEW